MMKCIQCGSADIVQGVRVVDRGDGNSKWDLMIETHRDPDAWVFKGAIKAPVHAMVCGTCGFVMLHANPKDVQELKQGK